MYVISSIWSTIRNFEGIVQEWIIEAMAEIVVLETITTDAHVVGEGPSGVDKDVETTTDDIPATTTDDQQMVESVDVPPTKVPTVEEHLPELTNVPSSSTTISSVLESAVLPMSTISEVEPKVLILSARG